MLCELFPAFIWKWVGPVRPLRLASHWLETGKRLAQLKIVLFHKLFSLVLHSIISNSLEITFGTGFGGWHFHLLGKISFSLNRKTVEIQTFSSHAAFSHGFPQVRRPVLEHAPYWNPCRSPRKTGKKFKILFPNSENSSKSTNPKILQPIQPNSPIQVFS